MYSSKSSVAGRICEKVMNETCNSPMMFHCSHQETHFCGRFAIADERICGHFDFNSELLSTERFEPPSVRVFFVRSRIRIWLRSLLLVVTWLNRDSVLSWFLNLWNGKGISDGKELTVSELSNDKWIGAVAFICTKLLTLMNSIKSLKAKVKYCVICFVMWWKAFETILSFLDKHFEELSVSWLPCYKTVSESRPPPTPRFGWPPVNDKFLEAFTSSRTEFSSWLIHFQKRTSENRMSFLPLVLIRFQCRRKCRYSNYKIMILTRTEIRRYFMRTFLEFQHHQNFREENANNI